MMRRATDTRWLSSALFGMALAAALFAAPGCGDDDKPTGTGDPTGRYFDFTLPDVNPRSASYEQQVSPVSYQGRPVVIFVALAG